MEGRTKRRADLSGSGARQENQENRGKQQADQSNTENQRGTDTGDKETDAGGKMMAEIKKKFHIQFRSIRNRMIFSFLSVFLAVIVFMGISIYLFTVNMLESRNQETYDRVLESAENVMTDRFAIYEGTARGILETRMYRAFCRWRMTHPENI